MTVPTLKQLLAEELSDEAGVAIALSIFNTAIIEDITRLLTDYCQQTSDPPHYKNAKHQLHQFVSEFLSR